MARAEIIDKERVLELLKAGYKHLPIAQELNCSRQYISLLESRFIEEGELPHRVRGKRGASPPVKTAPEPAPTNEITLDQVYAVIIQKFEQAQQSQSLTKEIEGLTEEIYRLKNQVAALKNENQILKEGKTKIEDKVTRLRLSQQQGQVYGD